MVSRDTQEQIERWVADFADSPTYQELPADGKRHAAEILAAFLQAACEANGGGPDALEEADLKVGLLEGVTRLDLPEGARQLAPAVCGALLAELEKEGRLSAGRSKGAYVRALRGAFQERCAPVAKTIRRPGSKIGRNEPCPCGSGKKFKKCCMR